MSNDNMIWTIDEGSIISSKIDMFFGVTIGLHRLRESASEPTFGTQDSACFDISAAFEPGMRITVYDEFNEKDRVLLTHDMEYVLLPRERALIPTGFVFDIPSGHSMRIHPRSGLALKNGITLANAEAVIDSDYTNETFVMLHNTTEQRFRIKNGDRIAQAEIVMGLPVRFRSVSEVAQKTDRTGGLGSTGV